MLGDWLRASGLTVRHLAAARQMSAPFVVLDERWPHHGPHSGYLITTEIGPLLPRNDRLLPHPLRKFLSRLMEDDLWEPRMLAQLMLRVGNAKVLHLVTGDFDTWICRKRANWLKTKMTATFHQPVDRLREIASKLERGMLDGIVCVSRNQMAILEHLVSPGRCVFIPHGVDTEFFEQAPTTDADAHPLLLAVGVHRRDFITLMSAARIIKSRRPDVRVRLIGPRDGVAGVVQDGVVEVVSDLSDAELRAAYRESSMLFLPLDEATANNALLESMATGRPAVITDLPAIHDYTTGDAALFCRRGDVQAHAEAALGLLDDSSLRARMGSAAYNRALDFSWPRVRKLLLTFLQEVCESTAEPIP
jgi:glycosyltransferase involved in cell wall biosynthesis